MTQCAFCFNVTSDWEPFPRCASCDERVCPDHCVVGSERDENEDGVFCICTRCDDDPLAEHSDDRWEPLVEDEVGDDRS